MMNDANDATERYVGPTVPVEVTVGVDADAITLSIRNAQGEGLEATLSLEQAEGLARHLLALAESRSATTLIATQIGS